MMDEKCGTFEGEVLTDFTEKSERKRSLGRSNRRRYDSIKINLKEMIWKNMERNDMAQERENGVLLLPR
jgi:hypothetical protein